MTAQRSRRGTDNGATGAGAHGRPGHPASSESPARALLALPALAEAATVLGRLRDCKHGYLYLYRMCVCKQTSPPYARACATQTGALARNTLCTRTVLAPAGLSATCRGTGVAERPTALLGAPRRSSPARNASRTAVGKQTTAAERGQQSHQVSSGTAAAPAHPAPGGQRGEGRRTPGAAGRRSPSQHGTAGTVQLPPPPEQLQQRAADPSPA